MALANVTASNCWAIQNAIFDAAINTDLNPLLKDTSRDYGAYNAIRQSTNEAGTIAGVIESTVKPTSAACKKWRFNYYLKDCAAADTCTDFGSGDTLNYCASVTDSLDAPGELEYQMTGCLEAKFKISRDDLRCAQEGEAFHLLKKTREAFMKLKKGVNDRWLSQLATMPGRYPIAPGADCATAVASLGVTAQTLNLQDATGKSQTRALFPIRKHFRRMGVSNPYIIGGDGLDLMLWEGGYYNPNSDPGINNITQTGLINNMYVDGQLDVIFADSAEHMIAFAPGSVFYLWWNKFASGDPINTETVRKSVRDIGAAFGEPGFLADEIIQVDPCNDSISYIYQVHTDLSTLPDNIFQDACGECWNYKTHYLVDCGAIDCTVKAA